MDDPFDRFDPDDLADQVRDEEKYRPLDEPRAAVTGENVVHPNVLARWLVLHGYAEDVRGYGHVTGEDLAEALLSEFVVTPRSNRGHES